MTRRSRDASAACDAGFTLIELIITVVIMGVITLPLGNFVIAYFQNYTDTSARVSNSHDIQIATAYFSQDVANTGLRTGTDYTPVQSVWVNSTPAPCATSLGNAVLLLEWDDWGTASPPTTDAAAYVVEANELHRVACSGSTKLSDITVVHDYVSAVPSCSPSACTATPAPTTITLTVNLKIDTETTSVDLVGQRRQAAS